MDPTEVRVFASLRVDAAIEVLQAFVPQTVGHAIRYLSMVHERLVLLGLFQHYFPKQFARSTASPYVAPGENGYSAAEREFLGLAVRHLFPLAEAMDGDGRFEGIPIQPVAVPYEDGDDEDSVYAVLGACGGAFDTSWPEVFVHWPVELPGLDPAVPALSYDHAKFEVLCNERGELYRHLPVALRVCAHDTGNWFLDTTDEEAPEFPPWSLSMVETVRREWAEAEKLLNVTGELARWLRDSPEAMVPVIEMLNASVSLEMWTEGDEDVDGEQVEVDEAELAEEADW